MFTSVYILILKNYKAHRPVSRFTDRQPLADIK